MLALIIAALMQLGVITASNEYTTSKYQDNQTQVDIIIDGWDAV